MLNHVFEHVDEPLKVLEQLYDLLKSDRFLLIRTPVMNSYAWHTYKTNWMSLDAPRHLIIHTQKSMRILCERSGFILKDLVYDSTGDSLIGSEQYKRDIPLIDKTSYYADMKKNKLFNKEQVAGFNRIAAEKNNAAAGDQAAFYLYKP
jgi:predicted SAM-dependent methyltransferase